MLKFLFFVIVGWFILKVFRIANYIKRKNNVTTQNKNNNNSLKINKGDIEDADFDDID